MTTAAYCLFFSLLCSDVTTGPGQAGELAIKLPLPPGALLDLYKFTDGYKQKYLSTYVILLLSRTCCLLKLHPRVHAC